jgi:hypothetical protein
MLGVFNDRRLFAHTAKVVDKLNRRVEKFIAFFTLITPSAQASTVRTSSNHKTISEKSLTVLTIALTHLLLNDLASFLNV